MPRILYDTETGLLQPYPRQDDEPVVGLDPSFRSLQLIQELPPDHNPSTERLEPTETIDLDAGAVTRSWQLVTLPPPPPGPDWPQFRQAIRSENGFYDAYRAALAADPMVVPLLGSRLDDFERDGNFEPFLESLTLTLQALPAQDAAHIAMEFLALASRCGLPPAFLDALQTLFPEPAP